MKRIFLMLFPAIFSVCVFAQEKEVIFSSSDRSSEPETKGFRKDMLFTGGNLNLGYYGGVTVLGADPHLGYSIASWLDAGISFGYTYTSQHDEFGNKYRQSLFSPGVFARLFPVNFLFASVQFEHNFIKTTAIYTSGSEYRENVSAASLLLGLGYTSERDGRNSPYYYFSISLDVLSNPNSPYRDVVFAQIPDPPGYKVVVNDPYPVVKAGINIPLFQGSGRR